MSSYLQVKNIDQQQGTTLDDRDIIIRYLRNPVGIEEGSHFGDVEAEFLDGEVVADFSEQFIAQDQPFHVASMQRAQFLVRVSSDKNVTFGTNGCLDDRLSNRTTGQ